MMGGDWMSWGVGGMWFGPLTMIGVLVLVIVLVVLVVRALGGGSPATQKRQGPREILDERFARGEISNEEYEQKRKTLGG